MPDLLHGYDIAADGRATPVIAETIGTPVPEGSFRWLHLDKSETTDAWLNQELDPIVAEALCQLETRPRATHHKSGTIVILRGVNLNPGADPEDMVSIRIWIEKSRIISVRRRKLMAIADLVSELEEGSGPKSPGDFVIAIAFKLTERMEPVITDLSDKADELEDKALDEKALISRMDNATLRREAILLRRYIAPQRDALNRLSTEPSDLINDRSRTGLREAADRVTRLVEELDAVRERCGVLHDQLADRRAEQMNHNMFVLSIVAAIFLPLGFLTGLLGVNVGGIPGADSSNGFAILCLIMLSVGIAITLIFKRLKWL